MWKTLKSVVRPQGRYKLVTSVMSKLTERGAGRPPRAYISIPAGTGADALGELRDRPMDAGRRTHTIPKTIRGLFGPHLINIVRKDLPDMARSSGEEGKGRFAVLEFREKGQTENGRPSRMSTSCPRSRRQ